MVRDAPDVKLIIQDQGPGIASQFHEKIFQRYERLDGTANVNGLGIGLYLVQTIVNAHSGRIHVESAPGRGARFVVEFPVGDLRKPLEFPFGNTKDASP